MSASGTPESRVNTQGFIDTTHSVHGKHGQRKEKALAAIGVGAQPLGSCRSHTTPGDCQERCSHADRRLPGKLNRR